MRIGIGELLTIIFIVLKLCGVITFSWILVFAPALIQVGIIALVLAILKWGDCDG